jgi:hypothetical protein
MILETFPSLGSPSEHIMTAAFLPADDNDDVYLRLQHGKEFQNFVYISKVKDINPAIRHK